jgi:hypothetical protein
MLAVHEAARSEIEPDRRIIAMLGARGKDDFPSRSKRNITAA